MDVQIDLQSILIDIDILFITIISFHKDKKNASKWSKKKSKRKKVVHSNP